jgi:hypothetical protein
VRRGAYATGASGFVAAVGAAFVRSGLELETFDRFRG